MTTENPVCKGCGKRHAPPTSKDVLDVALLTLAEEVGKVLETNPEAFAGTPVSDAFDAASEAAKVVVMERFAEMQAQQFQKPAAQPATGPTGFYL